MQVLLSVTHKKYSEIASLDKNVSMQVHHSPSLEVKKKWHHEKLIHQNNYQYCYINPLSTKSDQHQISPCNLSLFYKTKWSWELRTLSHKMNLIDTSTKFSPLLLLKTYRDNKMRMWIWMLGFKRVKVRLFSLYHFFKM